jgi:hypothetical protein
LTHRENREKEPGRNVLDGKDTHLIASYKELAYFNV